MSNDIRLSTDAKQVGKQSLKGSHFASASAIAQNTHTTLWWTLLDFEKNNLFSFFSALKIRVSVVRFRPRPPFKTVALLCGTAVFLLLQRVSQVNACAVRTCPYLALTSLNDAQHRQRALTRNTKLRVSVAATRSSTTQHFVSARRRVLAKTFLKVMTVWHNTVRPSNLRQRLLPHFLFRAPLKLADRAC